MSKNCRVCKSKDVEVFLDLGMMPLAGGFLDDETKFSSEIKYDLKIYICNECSLIQILDAVDPQILFTDYSFSSSTVLPLVKHFEDFAQWIVNNYKPNSLLEFGCNDGILLSPLKKLGVNIYGIDASPNIVEIAQNKNLNVVNGFFNENFAKSHLSVHGKVDVISGSNAFAHNENPEKILKAAKILLNEEGTLILEFMYAGDLYEQVQWDTLYHEHLTFYSLATISELLKKHGFYVFDALRLKMHGGSLRVSAKNHDKFPKTDSYHEIVNYEKNITLNNPDTWKSFGRFVNRKINIVSEVLHSLSKNNSIWAYGAAGKATMWVNACELNFLEAVVDASPLRANKFMPGTHTPIVFPDRFKLLKPDYTFITAWNYADNIKKNEDWYKGTWSTPLPNLMFF